MNTRLGLALATYLAVWAAVVGGTIYAIIQAGYSTWVAVAAAFLLFLFVNGSLAHRARVRQSNLEGKEPHSYFRYLLFPQGFPNLREEAPKFDHFVVGIAAVLTGLFFAFCGAALAFGAEWSRISEPIAAASFCTLLIGLGAFFLYLAWHIFASTKRPPKNVA